MQVKAVMCRKNAGFSLIEILISVAVVAIICIPVMAGFRSSSQLNYRAYNTQSTTVYAQHVVEDIKRMTVEEFVKKMKNETGLDPVLEKVEALANAFPGYPDDLFTKITCTQDDIQIGGRTYNMSVVYDPTPYSSDGTGIVSAADANVFALARVDSMDGLKFPLIAGEINKYEGNGDSRASFLNDLWWMLPPDERDALTYPNGLDDLYKKTDKTVDVIIKNAGTGRIRVVCNVTYEVSEYPIKKAYTVYDNSFELEKVTGDDGAFIRYAGNIYILAKAYFDPAELIVTSTNMIRNNTIRITNEYHADDLRLGVYLVRGYYYDVGGPENKRGVNFDHVFLKDTAGDLAYSSLAPGEVLSGEWLAGDVSGLDYMNFYTNIKGKNLSRILTDEDINQTIGRDVAKLRCYQVTVTLTDAEKGTTAAHIVSTKQN